MFFFVNVWGKASINLGVLSDEGRLLEFRLKCKAKYVGETGQHFCDRVKQHQNDIRYKKSTNGFYAHLKSNKKHSIEWEKAAFLGKERNWKGRRIKKPYS